MCTSFASPVKLIQGPPGLPGMEDFEEIFSEEFAAKAEEQLDHAISQLASENPQLWQHFERLAKGMAGEEGRGGEGAAGASEGAADSLEAQMEETLRMLREGTEQVEVGWSPL